MEPLCQNGSLCPRAGEHPLSDHAAPEPAETWQEQIERRLAAVEEHLQNLPPERVS